MGNTNSRGCACGGSRERDDSESRIVAKTSSADGVGDARRNYKQAEIERMIEDAYFSQELATFATMRSSTNVDADEVWSSANAQDFFEGDDELKRIDGVESEPFGGKDECVFVNLFRLKLQHEFLDENDFYFSGCILPTHRT